MLAKGGARNTSIARSACRRAVACFSTSSNGAGSSKSANASARPVLRKASVPFRDFNAVRRNARSVATEEDLALQKLWARHRPLFLLPESREDVEGGQWGPVWTQSPSGRDLNPDMKSVPPEVAWRLRPFEAQISENQIEDIEDAQKSESEDLLTDFTKVLNRSLKINVKGLQLVMPAGTSASVSLARKLKRGRPRYEQRYTISTRDHMTAEDDGSMGYSVDGYVASPASKSFARPAMSVTSVKRKRRIKMNRHKYKKRRKAQRALRVKLKR
uniref:Small ribosomal subunit protein mS38 n=1 Tax=Blastobotrys adeninivorans TaxID=409370 RepID=A0A060T345_BLAAD